MVSANTRASDSDRTDTCQLLDSALAEGQLSMEEHRQRVSAATKAATLGDLDALVSDLQVHKLPIQLPTPKSPVRVWGLLIAVTVVLVLVAGGIGWILRSTPAPSNNPAGPGATSSRSSPAVVASSARSTTTATTTTTTTTPQPLPDMLTLGGLTGFFAEMRNKFGDTMGYELDIRSDRVTFDRPSPANARNTEEWDYRKGAWTTRGDFWYAYESEVALGDLSSFDVQRVLDVVRDAPQILNMNGATTDYLLVRSQRDGSMLLRVFVGDASHSGDVTLSADGTVIDTWTSFY